MILINNINEKIKDFTEVIKRNPNIKELYIERAKLYDAKWQYKKAAEDFKRALPDYYTFSDIKEVCEKNYLIKEAEYFYTKEINKNKNSIDAYMQRLHFYMRIKQIEKAILDCKTILKLSPKDETISALYEILNRWEAPLQMRKGDWIIR